MGNDLQIIQADLNDHAHAAQFLRLTAAYMDDEMGGAAPWNDVQKALVVKDLSNHPGALILLAKKGEDFVGICTCFYAYSTFLARPLLNIHDIFVEPTHRGQGVGKRLLEKVGEIAVSKNCGKITLEVRKDNLNARDLYKSQGFSEAKHSMLFWIKHL